MNRRNQRGEGKLGMLVALAILGTAIFAGVKYVPVRVAAYEFRDEIRQACRHGAAYNKSAKFVENSIHEIADELDIPLKKTDLKVRRTRSAIVVEVQYEQPIDFAVTTYMYKFNSKDEAPLF